MTVRRACLPFIVFGLLMPQFGSVVAEGAKPATSRKQARVIASAAQRFAPRSTKAVPDFQKHVVPLLGKLGCNSGKCHGSFQGRGGFRLSLFGFDFRADHAALHARASSEKQSRVNLRKPQSSLLLRKPTEQVDHEGGQRLEMNSWQHHLLLRWIESGGRGASSPTQPGSSDQPVTKRASTQLAAKNFFEKKIRPLLQNNCYECHGFDNRKGMFQLKSRDLLLKGGKSGPAIIPGKPDKSLMIKAVRHSLPKLRMPPSGKLSKQEIADLEKWVRMGAAWPDNRQTNASQPGQVLKRLHFEPKEILFGKAGGTQQIRIIAEWEDGEREDVTCLTRFRSNNPAIVRVSAAGAATSTSAGDTHVVAFYDNGVAAIPVLRRYDIRRVVKAGNKPGRLSSNNPIDKFINQKLLKLGVVASGLCTDEEFLRRLSIDMTGSLPTPQEVTAFLQDKSAHKRQRKIDELLGRTSYAAWWANKLCDFTGCSPAAIRSAMEVALEDGYVKASEWYDWIYQRVARNERYDKLVAGIMLAEFASYRGKKGFSFRGSGRRINPDSPDMPHFWGRQSIKEPKDAAMSVAHSFLGIQLQCAECHKHPFDRWTQADFNDFASFFVESGTQRKQRRLRLLRSHDVTLTPGSDPRKPIMDWLRNKKNPWFARAFVNRVWAGYFHKGIVEPPDQFTPANPPSHPKLLDWLTQQFIARGFDMKWLHRQIVSSHAYQRSWRPNATNRLDQRNFSRAQPRRIPAEVLYDAMKQATAASDKLDAVRTNLKRRASGHLSMRMAGTHAMKVFGKPARALNCDCERVNRPTLLQAVFMQNDPLVRIRLADSGWIAEVEEAIKKGQAPARRKLIHEIYLRTVNRPPREEEIKRCLQHLSSVKSPVEGITDLMWAMMNTKEFLLNH